MAVTFTSVIWFTWIEVRLKEDECIFLMLQNFNRWRCMLYDLNIKFGYFWDTLCTLCQKSTGNCETKRTLFIHSSIFILSPLKWAPFDATHICQRFFQTSKHSPVWPSAPSTNFLLWLQSSQNEYPRATILVSEIEWSHTGPDLVCTVVDRWYLLRFFSIEFGKNCPSMRWRIIIV